MHHLTFRNKIIFSLLFCLTLFALAHPVNADLSTPPDKRFKLDDIKTLLTTIIDWAWKIFATLAIIMFIVAGTMFLTAAGNESQISTAKKAAIWGAVGVFVAIIGFSLEAIIKKALGF